MLSQKDRERKRDSERGEREGLKGERVKRPREEEEEEKEGQGGASSPGDTELSSY